MFLSTLIPIIFKNFIATSKRGLSFLLSSPRFLNFDIPVDLHAIKKINKNSSIAELFKLFGQLIDLKYLLLSTLISPIIHLYNFFYLTILILAFILFKIFKIPILDGFILMFLINNSEFFDNNVRTIKKDAELMSPGIL